MSTVRTQSEIQKQVQVKNRKLTDEDKRIESFVQAHRKTVVVQGLGFVGTAMTAALVTAKDKKGDILYNVIGVELADEKNVWKIEKTNQGEPPVTSNDESINMPIINFVETETKQ